MVFLTAFLRKSQCMTIVGKVVLKMVGMWCSLRFSSCAAIDSKVVLKMVGCGVS